MTLANRATLPLLQPPAKRLIAHQPHHPMLSLHSRLVRTLLHPPIHPDSAPRTRRMGLIVVMARLHQPVRMVELEDLAAQSLPSLVVATQLVVFLG